MHFEALLGEDLGESELLGGEGDPDCFVLFLLGLAQELLEVFAKLLTVGEVGVEFRSGLARCGSEAVYIW